MLKKVIKTKVTPKVTKKVEEATPAPAVIVAENCPDCTGGLRNPFTLCVTCAGSGKI